MKVRDLDELLALFIKVTGLGGLASPSPVATVLSKATPELV